MRHGGALSRNPEAEKKPRTTGTKKRPAAVVETVPSGSETDVQTE